MQDKKAGGQEGQEDTSSENSGGEPPFEPPSRWESILAPGLQEVGPQAPLDPAVSSSGTPGGLEGDYMWTSEDCTTESFLRVLADGQWWHAAHRLTNGGSSAQQRPEEAWGLAESIGSWYRVPIPGDAVEHEASRGPAVGLVLACEDFRWARELPDAPLAPHHHHASASSSDACGSRGEVELAVAGSKVVFCYAVCECRLTGAQRLELHMPELMCLSSFNAMAALGFAAQYYKADSHPWPGHILLPAPD